MRITDQQKKAFISALSPFIANRQPAELRLFGSRMDDDLKGGDIDLLVVCADSMLQQHLSLNKAKILARIFMIIEEEKIDLTVTTKEKVQTEPFLMKVYPSSLLLHKWN